MNYYIALFVTFIACFYITELITRHVMKKKITVSIKNKDGSVSKHLVYAGRDPEVDKLLAEARKNKKAA